MQNTSRSSLYTNSIQEISNCLELVSELQALDVVVTRIESLIEAIRHVQTSETVSWGNRVVRLLEEASWLIVSELDRTYTLHTNRGRPKLHVSMSSVEYLLSMNFKATKIAELFSVSRETLCRRMKSFGISVS